MKITKHISFFFIEDRLKYVNRIIAETNNYKYTTDIFIHTNQVFEYKLLQEYKNGSLNVIVHDLTDIHPFKLTWKPRDLLKHQKDDYDIFIYVEDDILIPKEAIEYWLKYNEQVIAVNRNLGFLRIEIDDKNDEYISDLWKHQFLRNIVDINGDRYCVNDFNPYCAFWIYNKTEFNRFVDSHHYDVNNVFNNTYYEMRESSAIGLHGIGMNWYIHTVIPMDNDNKLNPACRVYHMPNNYVNESGDRGWATIKFSDVVVIN
jgi:hypothetical protein